MRLPTKLTQKGRNVVAEDAAIPALERAALAFLKTMTDKAPTGVYIIQNQKFCYVNQTFREITGFSDEELMGSDSLELVIPEDRGMVRENAIKMLNGEIINPFEFRTLSRDGTIKYVMASVSSFQLLGCRAVLGSFFDISGRKAAEERSQKSEDKARALFKGIPYPTCIWRKQGDDFELADFNTAAYQSTEGQIAGFLGEKCSEFFHERPDLVNDIVHCYNSHETVKHETGYRFHGTGALKSIIFTNVFVLPDMVMVHTEDVTQHRQAGLALIESEEHFRLLTKLTPFPLCVTDGTAVMEYVNDRFTSVFGYRLEDIPTGEKWFEMAYPDEKYREAVKDSWNEAMEKSKSTGKPFEPQEYWVTCKDGSLCIVEVSATSIGKKALVVFSDVTQHRRIEDELKKSDDFNKNLLSNAPNPVLATNPDSSIRYINPAFEKLTGFSREELIGCRSPYPWWPKNNYQALQTANAEGRKKDLNILERHYTTKDGQMFWVNSTIKPVKYDGEVEYYLSNWVDVTQRKLAEAELNESQANYSNLFESMTQGVVYHDREGRIISSNPAAREILGFSESQILGLSLPFGPMHFFQEDGSELALEALPAMQALTTCRPVKNFLMGVFNPTFESLRWLNVSAVPEFLPGDQNRPFRVFTTFTDITDLKAANEELRRKNDTQYALNSLLQLSLQDMTLEALLKRAVETIFSIPWLAFQSRGCIFLAEPDTEKLTMNVQSGLTEEMLCSCAVIPFGFCLCGRAALTQQTQFCNSLDHSHEGKYTEIRPHGHYCVPIVFNGKTLGVLNVYIKEGHVRSRGEEEFLGSIANALAGIISRKRAEAALRRSEEKSRLIFESVAEGIAVVDMQGTIGEVNQRMLDMHGLTSKNEIVGKPALEFIEENDRPIILQGMHEMMKSGALQKIEAAALRPDGQKLLVEVSTGLIKDTNGQPVGSVASLRDITETKRMQQQLMLTDRMASLGELSAGVAHELNNPLTGVIGFSQLILEGDVPPQIREDLGIIASEAQRAAKIVKNLLTFARKQPPVKALHQLNDCIREVLNLRSYEQKNLNIQVIDLLDAALPKVMMDYSQIQQVIINIVINAEFFMTQFHKCGTLTVSTQRHENYVRASFGDDGPGISGETLRHIFSPFFTTKEVGKGTGLGLSICHGIIQEHGGKIYVESEPGKGATFVVELPMGIQ